MSPGETESSVFRPAGVSYLRIPASDPHQTANFYREVFGWTVDTARPEPSFEDGTGHVIGHLRVATFRDPAGNVLGIWQRATTG